MKYLTGYALALALCSHAYGQVTIPRCDAPPVIDGQLDDACWSAAAKLDAFVQIRPGDNTPPSRNTIVLLAYDAQALYIGVRADDDPSRIRATLAKRDDILNDDHVVFYLDTFDDRQRAYVLAFNPLGIQQDGIYTEGREIDYSADLVMQSKGSVGASGYAIEAAIPFSSIRHRSGSGRKWGLHVERRIPHLDEDESWMPRTRGNANLLAQAGTIDGIERVDTRRLVEVIPEVTAQKSDADPGMTAKLGLSSDVVADVAVNPDFAQIESDQLVSTTNQRFPIFFEEKRPFFLEGMDVFQTPLNAVHSRTIVDPDYAAKVSGKHGRNTFALLVASDNAPGVLLANGRNASSGAMRVRHDVGAESYIGAIATSYNFADRFNRLAGADGRLTLDKNTVLTFQLAGTWAEHDSRGVGFFVEWRRAGRHLNTTISGEGRTRGYRADLGFTRQTDTNRWSIVHRYDSEPRPNAKLLLSWSFTNTLFSQWDWRGHTKYAYVYPRVTFNFRRQTQATIYLYADYLRLFEEEFGTPFFEKPERSTLYKGFVLDVQTKPSKLIAAGVTIGREWDSFDYDFGAPPRFARVSPAALLDPNAPLDPGAGTLDSVSTHLEAQPVDALRITFDYLLNRLVRNDTNLLAFDERLYSTQATYHFTSSAFARARVDYESLRDTFRGQLLVGWSPHPGTSLYAGYTRDDVRRAVFVKLSYLVRRAW